MLPLLAIAFALGVLAFIMSRERVVWDKSIALMLLVTVGISFLVGMWLDSRLSYTLLFEWGFAQSFGVKIGFTLGFLGVLAVFGGIFASTIRMGQLTS